MSIERFIHGKHDNGHHEGKRSEIRRLQASDEELRTIWPELWDAIVNGEYSWDEDFKNSDLTKDNKK